MPNASKLSDRQAGEARAGKVQRKPCRQCLRSLERVVRRWRVNDGDERFSDQ